MWTIASICRQVVDSLETTELLGKLLGLILLLQYVLVNFGVDKRRHCTRLLSKLNHWQRII